MQIENDFLFSQHGRTYTWDVYADGELMAKVQADTANHACDYICRTRWLSRHKLTAMQAEEETK